MRMSRTLPTLAVLLLAFAGCEGRPSRITAPSTVLLTAGPTTSVTVNCPSQMEAGTSAQCSAYGYDASGVYTGEPVSTWASGAPSVASISASGVVTAQSQGTAAIYATISGVTGSTSLSVVPSTAPPLQVSIGGPTSIRPNTTCEWWANVSGGVSPYSYLWSQSAGTGGPATSDFYDARSSTGFLLTLRVTDAAGHTSTATLGVGVSSTARACLL